jgi:hypothetical protein
MVLVTNYITCVHADQEQPHEREDKSYTQSYLGGGNVVIERVNVS